MIKFLLGGLTCLGAYHLLFEPFVVDWVDKGLGMLGSVAFIILLDLLKKNQNLNEL